MKIIDIFYKCPLLKFDATKCTDTYIIYLVMYLYNILVLDNDISKVIKVKTTEFHSHEI